MSKTQRNVANRVGRRRFLKSAGAGAVALTMATLKKSEPLLARPMGANDDLRLAVLGVGASGLGVGGRGRQLIAPARSSGCATGCRV